MASPSSRKSSSTEKPSLASNPYNPNSAAYLAYPVKHVMSSLYRRMTEPPDQPVHRLLNAPSPSGSRSSSQAPARRASPFQPPPLSPLALETGNLTPDQIDSLLLTRYLAEEIRLLVPARLQLLNSWRLAYSLSLHGSSLGTLYSQCEAALGALGSTQRGGFVLVVRDGSPSAEDGSVFGAYLTDPPKPSQHYYGTGECFLWRASILPSLRNITVSSMNGTNGPGPAKNKNKHGTISEDALEMAGLPPPPSADTTHAQRTTTVRGQRRSSSISKSSRPTSPPSANTSSNPQPLSPSPSGTSTPDRIRFKAFPYSGLNDFMIYCESSYLSVGGGDGHYGLWLDDQLENGVSETCPTFGNEGLSEEGKNFDVMGVEVWYIGS